MRWRPAIAVALFVILLGAVGFGSWKVSSNNAKNNNTDKVAALTPTTAASVTSQCVGTLPPVPSTALQVSTAPVDFEGDGSADVLKVYRLGAVWHARAEIAGVGVDDEVVVGPAPGPSMRAIGGATIDNDAVEEALANVAVAPSANVIGMYVFRGCELQRVLDIPDAVNFEPATFLVGPQNSFTCLGGNAGVEYRSTSSSDGGTTYSGSSSVFTIDLSGPSPTLVYSGGGALTSPEPGGLSCDGLTAP